MALYCWDVTCAATRDERPNLRTQATTRVVAATQPEALEKGIKSLEYSGWRPYESMSVIKRWKAG